MKRKTDIGIHSGIFIFMLQCMLFVICNKAAFGFGVIYCKSPCFLNFSKTVLKTCQAHIFKSILERSQDDSAQQIDNHIKSSVTSCLLLRNFVCFGQKYKMQSVPEGQQASVSKILITLLSDFLDCFLGLLEGICVS